MGLRLLGILLVQCLWRWKQWFLQCTIVETYMKFAVWVWKLFTDAARAKNSSVFAIGLNLTVEFLFSVDFSPDIWYQSLYMKPFVHLTYVSVCGVKLWRYCSKSLTYASFLLLSFHWNCFHDFFSNFYVKNGAET